MEILQAMLHLLRKSLYGSGCWNYAKVNENKLYWWCWWIMNWWQCEMVIRLFNSEVTRLFDAARYIHRLHLKVYTRLLLFDVYIKCFLWLIIKWLLLTLVSILHKYLTDETIDSAATKKRTGVATPVSLQAQYWFERNAINKLSSA